MLIQIADKYSPRIQRAIAKAIMVIRSRLPESLIIETLGVRGIDGIMDLLRTIEDDFSLVLNELDNAVRESGVATVQLIPSTVLLNPQFGFDVFSANTIDFLRQYRLNLIHQITSDIREVIRTNLQRGLIAGKNPRTIARNLRRSIGLTSRQEQAVENYRRALEDLDSTVLTRMLRDRRFDSAVQRAIRDGKTLSQAQIDRMVERYRQRSVANRAETIARTESMRAVSVGNRMAMQQLVASGSIDSDRLRRQWVYTHDMRTRAHHRTIPGMNKGGIPLEGFYQTELGPLAYPRDPSGSASNTINCRCTERYFVMEGDAV